MPYISTNKTFSKKNTCDITDLIGLALGQRQVLAQLRLLRLQILNQLVLQTDRLLHLDAVLQSLLLRHFEVELQLVQLRFQRILIVRVVVGVARHWPRHSSLRWQIWKSLFFLVFSFGDSSSSSLYLLLTSGFEPDLVCFNFII
jgi:hypothetical protein